MIIPLFHHHFLSSYCTNDGRDNGKAVVAAEAVAVAEAVAP